METILAGIIFFGALIPAIATVNWCYRAVMKITGSSGMFVSLKQKCVWYFVAWVFYGGTIGYIFGFSSSEVEQKKDSSANSPTYQTQTPSQVVTQQPTETTPSQDVNQQAADTTPAPVVTTPDSQPQPYVGSNSPEKEPAITARYYDLSLASQVFHHLEVPDFIFFATEGEFYTQATDISLDSSSLRVQFFYDGEFSSSISSYAFYLNDLGFTLDKSTSIYTVTKEVSGYILSVAAWAMSEQESVVVEISLKETQQEGNSSQSITHKLEGDGIENQVTVIRTIYNEIMENYANGSYRKASLGDGVTAYYDGFDESLRYVQVQRGYDQVDYARHYYFHQGELIFLFKEGADSYRLYFYQGQLFRNRYTDVYGNATNYEYETTDSYLYLENFARTESEYFQYRS